MKTTQTRPTDFLVSQEMESKRNETLLKCRTQRRSKRWATSKTERKSNEQSQNVGFMTLFFFMHTQINKWFENEAKCTHAMNERLDILSSLDATAWFSFVLSSFHSIELKLHCICETRPNGIDLKTKRMNFPMSSASQFVHACAPLTSHSERHNRQSANSLR